MSEESDDSEGSTRFNCSVNDHEIEGLLDDFVFEPNPWDMATAMSIGLDPETDPEALDVLADAMLAWAQGPELEQLTNEALDRVWNGELEQMIRDGLNQLCDQDDWKQGVTAALADFERAPRESEVAREVIRNLAMQLGHQGTPVLFCLCCIDDAIEAAPSDQRRGVALHAAIATCRNAAIPVEELQRAVRSPASAGQLGTIDRRTRVRTQLARIAEISRESMPPLSLELQALAQEPLPRDPADDDVWAVVSEHLLAQVAQPDWN